MKALVPTVLCLAAALTAGAFTESIAYHGKLVALDDSVLSTKRPMAIEFRVFAAESPNGQPCEWGRRVPVTLKSDGSFYVELSDSLGASVSGAKHEKLADALAAVASPWLSLTPAGYSEMLPRKPIGKSRRAHVAAKAKAADRVDANLLAADAISASRVTVDGDLSATGKVTYADVRLKLTLDKLMSVGTGDSEMTVKSGAFPSSYCHYFNFIGQDRSSMYDVLATTCTKDLGAFTLVVPAGMSIPSFTYGGIGFCTVFCRGSYNPFP